MAEQVLTLGEVKRRLFRFLQQRLPDVWDTVLDDDLIRLCNKVAKDINRNAHLHKERYSKTLTADITYLEVQRDIAFTYYLYHFQSNWKDQRYGTFNDNYVFELPVKANSKLDIIYLGAIQDITNTDTDAIDLPGYALGHFFDLLKDAFIVEFGDTGKVNYDERLQYYVRQLRRMENNSLLNAIPRSYEWGGCSSSTYDITDQRVTAEYILTDSDGVPYIIQQ